MRADFTCPFCYEDFDITLLCYHLEDEHCLETKNVVCIHKTVRGIMNVLLAFLGFISHAKFLFSLLWLQFCLQINSKTAVTISGENIRILR